MAVLERLSRVVNDPSLDALRGILGGVAGLELVQPLGEILGEPLGTPGLARLLVRMQHLILARQEEEHDPDMLLGFA